MADVDDRWHSFRPRAELKPCDTHTSTKGPLYPTTRHGVGKRWAARWRDEGKKQRVRSFEKREQANTFLDMVRADLARGVYVDDRAGRETFRAYATKWLAMQTFDPATMEATGRRLRTQVYPVLGDLALRTVSPSIIQAWVAGLAKTRAPSTVRVTLGTVSTILGAAVEDGLIARNPCRSSSIRPPAAPRGRKMPWTLEQVEAVRGAIRPERYAATVPAGVGLGLRQGEIFGLGVDDVDFLRNEVHVVCQVKRVDGVVYFAPPKGGKIRDVPLAEVVKEALAEHLRQFPAVEVTLPWLPDGKPHTVRLVFATGTGSAVSLNSFTLNTWKRALVAAGIEATPGNGMHVLRHTFASVLLSEGVDVRTLAEYLGHTDPAFTLRIYAHLVPAAVDRARQAIDRVFRTGGVPDVRHATA